MMDIYIAARYSRKHEAQHFARMAGVVPGIGVTSRWHMQDDAEEGEPNIIRDPAKGRVYAQRDLDDIQAADMLVLFSETMSAPRGSRHVEFGYALALGKFLMVIGPRENIFHTLPQILVVQDYHAALRALANLGKDSL